MKLHLLFALALVVFSSFVGALESSVSVLEKYKTVAPGEEIQFLVNIIDTDRVGRHDVALTYSLFFGDFNVASSKELKAIETQASFVGRMVVPHDAQPGQYMLYASVDGSNSWDTFNVRLVSSSADYLWYYLIFITLAILFVAIMILFELHKIHLSNLEGAPLGHKQHYEN